MWSRDPARAGVAARRKQRALAEKESQRWLDSFQESIRVAGWLPGSRIINVADREADIYELFAEAARHPEVGVLVRARHNRRLQLEQKSLWDFITAQPVAGQMEITVPRKPGVASQRASLEIRFGEVTIRKKRSALQLWIVEARQTGVSAAQAICWRLLTNQPVSDLAGAVEKVAWYRQRWRIEEFHRVLKTGCQAEARQLETVVRLKNVLAVDLIIAWRVLELTRLSRQSPDLPATELLTEDEVKVLCVMCKPLAGRSTLKLREAVRAIAQWGGFLARKGDGEPGPMTLWLGLLRLNDYVNAFNIFSKTYG
jgi:Transposase Tn5 dimerisation domain